MTYDPKALNGWERFKLDWAKFWSGTGGKVVAVTVFVAALVLAICCPQFALILIATVVDIGLTVMLGGITGGLSSVANGSGFWDGAGSYVNDNIALTATTELILAMAAFGITQAIASVKSVQPVKASQAADTAERELTGVDGIIEELSDLQLRNFGEPGKSSGFRQIVGTHKDAMKFVQSQTKGLTEYAPGKFVGKNSRGVEFRVYERITTHNGSYTSIRINGVAGLKGIKFLR